jgi:translation initiation factor RLI1
MTPRVKLDEWDTLSTELRRFGRAGDVTVADDRIHIDFGSAHVEVARDGTLKTGMPLHDFAHDNTAVIVVDHDAGTLTVEADSVSYTFRRPGG